ncbi:IS21 family transposase [Aliiroseovarius sp. 2305UL8-7]|uniref:IS21 family transposase n=1 Tax=Aliiroseovarius conchicola TaxID=3121637 RepID=UPI003526E360
MLTSIQRRARLILQGRLNNTEISELTNSSRNTVREWRKRIGELQITLEDIVDLDDLDIRKIVTPGAFKRAHKFESPDWEQVLFERSERGVKGKTLYREYIAKVPEHSRAMSRTTFYRTIRKHAADKKVTIAFDYEPGEMLQVDFVGRKKAKQPILVDEKGMERDYEIFCAVSAKSRRMYVVAIESQAKLPVLAAFVSMLEFFDGVPVLVTIDNFKAAVAIPRSSKCDARLTPEFQELADHYRFGLKAVRVRKPKYKAIVENGVGITQDDILAPLRNRRFLSLAELNQAITELLAEVNSRPLSVQPYKSRDELFSTEDWLGFQPMPSHPFEPGRWILKVRAGLDYHVLAEGTRYSLPFRLANELTNIKLTPTTVHISHGGRTVATHLRQDNARRKITNPKHMPVAHRHAAMTRLTGMKNCVREIGSSAEKLIDMHFRTGRSPAKTAKNAIRLSALTDQYPTERVAAACDRAITVGKPSAKTVENILASGLDTMSDESLDPPELPEPQENVRGASYYASLLQFQLGGKGDV